jgi:hypothetical protein
MLAGAVAGAAMYLHTGSGLPVLVAALVVGTSLVLLWRSGAATMDP